VHFEVEARATPPAWKSGAPTGTFRSRRQLARLLKIAAVASSKEFNLLVKKPRRVCPQAFARRPLGNSSVILNAASFTFATPRGAI